MSIHFRFRKDKGEKSQESTAPTGKQEAAVTEQPAQVGLLKRFRDKAKARKAQAQNPSPPPTAKPPSSEGGGRKGFFDRLFHRHSSAKPQEEDIDERMARQTRRLLKREQRKHRRERMSAAFRRKMLQSLLIQAGLDIKHERLNKVVFYISLATVAFLSAITLTIAAFSGKSALDILIFMGGVWTACFAFVYLFAWMVIYLYLDIRIYNRTQELEDVLPDFLQLASTNISAGMPIDRALWFAVRPNFGVLAREIEQVAKETIAGEDLTESLRRFTERYDSAMLRRSISILLEGIAAGGEIADLLNKIAQNIQETKILRKDMSANVATYAIFITFASIIMAPVLFGLATQLLTIIVTLTAGLDLTSSSSFFALNIQTDPGMIQDFRWFSMFMLSITALMSASIVAVIRKGRVKEGLRNLPIFVVVSLSIYFLVSTALGSMIGQLI